MSIPGLGQIPEAPAASSTRTVSLRPFWEWRFEVGFAAPITLKLIAGKAEKDGTELASRVAYRLRGVKSKILTYHGCELEVDGRCDDEFVAEYANPMDNPANSYLNLHHRLTTLREASARAGHDGPRVMIAGPSGTGKTSLARTLAALAVRVGQQPLVVNANPRQGMLTLPGTVAACVFATVMDVEMADGWGSTPSSGPSTVPVKAPLVFQYGHAAPEDDPALYRQLMSRLAGPATARFNADPAVKSAGMIIDMPRISERSKVGLDCLAHVVDEFSVNVIIILGSSRLTADLTRRFATEKTSLGEPIYVVGLDKSDGVVERDAGFMQQAHEAAIKEYFFGDARRTLSPFTQLVDFDSLVFYQAASNHNGEPTLTKVDASPMMAHWTFAVMNASTRDSPDTIRMATVMGFVYVGDVDKDKRRMKVLSPVSGRLGDRPLVWGKWPEPYINLLG